MGAAFDEMLFNIFRRHDYDLLFPGSFAFAQNFNKNIKLFKIILKNFQYFWDNGLFGNLSNTRIHTLTHFSVYTRTVEENSVTALSLFFFLLSTVLCVLYVATICFYYYHRLRNKCSFYCVDTGIMNEWVLSLALYEILRFEIQFPLNWLPKKKLCSVSVRAKRQIRVYECVRPRWH